MRPEDPANGRERDQRHDDGEQEDEVGRIHGRFESMRVALLGTGIMGSGLARNIVAAGHELTVWNRSREKAEAVEGARVADTPAEAWRGADALVTMLADGPAVHAAVGGLESFDGVWLQMSTVGVVWTEQLAARSAR